MNPRSTWSWVAAALVLWAATWWWGPGGGRSGRGASGGARGAGPTPTIDPAGVTVVELVRSNVSMRVEKVDGEWWIRRPLASKANPAKVREFLEALSKLKPRSYLAAGEFAADDESLKAFGLGRLTTELTVEGLHGRSAFHLGGPAPMGSQFYFRFNDDAGILTADRAFLQELPGSANEWRDPVLVDLMSLNFDRIEIRGGLSLEARRDAGAGGGWRLSKPMAARADGARIAALLNELQSLRVTQFVSDGPLSDPESFGLAPAEFEIVLSRRTNELVRLHVGKAVGQALDQVFVRNALRSNLVTVSGEFLAHLRQPVAQFRDHQLLPSLEGVDQFEFRVGEERAVVEREGTNWFVTAPSRFRADGPSLEGMLSQFESLRILDFTADVMTKPEVYGLDKPLREYWFRRTVTNAGLVTNLTVAHVLFGLPLGVDRIHVMRADEPASVYSTPNLLLRFPETANQMRDWRFGASNVVRVVSVRGGKVREIKRDGSGNWGEAPGAGGASTVVHDAVEEVLHRMGNWVSDRYALRNEKPLLESGGFKERSHEVTLYFRETSGVPRKWRMRFGASIANNVVVLANFDDDPVAIRISIPATLYGDVLAYFSSER